MLRTENAYTGRRPAEVLEWLFLLMTGVYLVCQCVHNSTYVLPVYTFPDRTQFLRILILTGMIVLLKADLSGGWKMRIPLLAAVSAVCFMTYRNGRELFLLMLPVLMIGAAGMDYHKILRVYVIAVGSFLAVTFLCAFTGVIPNLVFCQRNNMRSSWGLAYPTDMASLVLFLVMAAWLAWDKAPDGLAALGALGSFLISRAIADSRTSALCSLLFLGMIALKTLSERAGRRSKTGWPEKSVHLLSACSFLIFAAVFFGSLTVYARGGEAGKLLNVLLSNRLRNTLEIYRDQGIHLFGKSFQQIGMGGDHLVAHVSYFLDSSYAQLLIRYGLAMFLSAGALWTALGLRAGRVGNGKLLCVMMVIAFHALSEHHFADVQYNILLILPFADIPVAGPAPKEKITLARRFRDNWPAGAAAAAELALAVWAAPRGLSRLRTVFGIWGTESTGNEVRAVVWCFAVLTAGAGLCGLLCALAGDCGKKKKLSGKKVLFALLCAAILCGAARTDSSVIRSAASSGLLSGEEAEALRLMTETTEGTVTAEELPELAIRSVPALRRTVLYGDDLARLKNASIAVRVTEGRQRFADMGFLFTRISANLAVFSNDASVIGAMRERGFVWTDYDAAEKMTVPLLPAE